MKKRKRRLNSLIMILLILLVTIGFALLSANLNIRGTSTIVDSKWDIHFENITQTTGSVSATTEPTIDTDKVKITYGVTLDKPGDFYDFTVDVVNRGTIDAKLESLPTLGGLTTAQDEYINYTYKHADNTPIVVGEEIKAGESKKFQVHVEYDKNITKSNLPTTDQNMTLTVTMNYVQK